MLLVGGEAGIGKSALVRHYCEGATRTARVLISGCDAMQTPRPLGPLQDMAPSLGPPFTTLLDDDAARQRVFGQLLDALRTRATVAVFEDLHWADDATLDLLRYLGRRIDATRSLVIASDGDHRSLAGAHVTVASSLTLDGRPSYTPHFERASAHNAIRPASHHARRKHSRGWPRASPTPRSPHATTSAPAPSSIRSPRCSPNSASRAAPLPSQRRIVAASYPHRRYRPHHV